MPKEENLDKHRQGTQFKAGNTGGGRRKGVPNKVTSDTRKFFADFVEKNRARMQVLLDKVADGAFVTDKTTHPDGSVTEVLRTVIEPNPAKALELILDVAEFCLPKLQRVEWTGEDGEPLAPPVFHIGFKNGGPGGG